MRTVSDDERRYRLGVRHALAAPVGDVLAAARAVVCLHATEPASVYLSAAARSVITRAAVDDALYGVRTLVRQLAMRRTVFAFPRELMPAVRGSAGVRVQAQQATRLIKDIEAAGLARDGRAWLDAVNESVLEALRDQPATTAELRMAIPELASRVPPPNNPAGGAIPIASRVLLVLAAGGAVVRGENRGDWTASRPVWSTVEDWMGPCDPLDERAGYTELVTRWLWSFGPGTEADLVWWFGATKAAMRRALADIGAVEVRLADDASAWLHPDDTDPIADPGDWAALLPALDPSTMGWQSRRFYLGPHAERLFDRSGNGRATAWWNGRIVGGWTQDERGRVVLRPMERLGRAARAALKHRADELSDWLDGDRVREL